MEPLIFKVGEKIIDIDKGGNFKIIEPPVFEDVYMIPSQTIYFSSKMAKELIKKLNEHYKTED